MGKNSTLQQSIDKLNVIWSAFSGSDWENWENERKINKLSNAIDTVRILAEKNFSEEKFDEALLGFLAIYDPLMALEDVFDLVFANFRILRCALQVGHDDAKWMENVWREADDAIRLAQQDGFQFVEAYALLEAARLRYFDGQLLTARKYALALQGLLSSDPLPSRSGGLIPLEDDERRYFETEALRMIGAINTEIQTEPSGGPDDLDLLMHQLRYSHRLLYQGNFINLDANFSTFGPGGSKNADELRAFLQQVVQQDGWIDSAPPIRHGNYYDSERSDALRLVLGALAIDVGLNGTQNGDLLLLFDSCISIDAPEFEEAWEWCREFNQRELMVFGSVGVSKLDKQVHITHTQVTVLPQGSQILTTLQNFYAAACYAATIYRESGLSACIDTSDLPSPFHLDYLSQ